MMESITFLALTAKVNKFFFLQPISYILTILVYPISLPSAGYAASKITISRDLN